MEDVLDVYAEPYDPTRPKVNFDETNKQLIQETRQPLPARPGQPQRYDYEYARNGTRNLFLFVEPQTGWRHVQVTEQRTKLDFAHAMQWLVDEGYPEATVIRVVLDNLNTHKIASLYEAFEPAEARRIARKLELHYTPKHGSWLNMAEIELSVLQQQFPLMNCESYVTVAADTSRSVSTTHCRLLERLSQSARTRYLVASRLIS